MITGEFDLRVIKNSALFEYFVVVCKKNIFLVSYQTPMRKCFVSRDLKRQHCLGDELCVIPCRLLFCYYV